MRFPLRHGTASDVLGDVTRRTPMGAQGLQVDPRGTRLVLQVDLRYDVRPLGADLILHIHPARTDQQTVGQETVSLNQPILAQLHADPVTGNRTMRLRALPGPLILSYVAAVNLVHDPADLTLLREVPVHDIHAAAMGYIYPSRYCQSDRLIRRAAKEFGHLPTGYSRVRAICEWVRQHVSLTSQQAPRGASAVDTLVGQVGGAQEQAHLMIALCRALNIPARFVTGTRGGVEPAEGYTDFHAYVEAFVGQGWCVFDPSGLGSPRCFVRVCTGRDAADVALATLFSDAGSGGALIRTVPAGRRESPLAWMSPPMATKQLAAKEARQEADRAVLNITEPPPW